MAGENKKVRFGLKNVHYAVANNLVESGYDTPVSWPGAVDLVADPIGEDSPFYADDIVYYSDYANNGYDCQLEVALIPDDFLKDVLGMTVDNSGVMFEGSEQTHKEFALLFEFTNDVGATRHLFYRCVPGRPSINGHTKEDTVSVQTETLPFRALPLIDHKHTVKAKLTSAADTTTYNSWYSAVYPAPVDPLQ